jgi:hypothetical protein
MRGKKGKKQMKKQGFFVIFWTLLLCLGVVPALTQAGPVIFEDDFSATGSLLQVDSNRNGNGNGSLTKVYAVTNKVKKTLRVEVRVTPLEGFVPQICVYKVWEYEADPICRDETLVFELPEQPRFFGVEITLVPTDVGLVSLSKGQHPKARVKVSLPFLISKENENQKPKEVAIVPRS